MIIAMLQNVDQALQQVRDQIRAARQEALAARQAQGATTPQPGGTPVTIQQIPWDPNQGIPPRAVDISVAFFVTLAIIILGFPLMRAIGRRVDRVGAGSAQQIPPAISAQLNQLTQAVDAIAVEVERISEGQRFTTRLLAEQREASRTVLAPAAGDRPAGS